MDPSRQGPLYAWIAPEEGPAIFFDIIVDENNENSSELSSHPVEIGSDVTDNVRHSPEKYTVTGVVSNTPITPGNGWAFQNVSYTVNYYQPPITGLSSAISAGIGALGDLLFGTPPMVAKLLQSAGPYDNVTVTHNALTAIERSGGICTVFASTKQYDSMVMTKVLAPRKKSGHVEFNVEFTRINIVATASVSAPKPLIKAAVPSKAAGPQTPKDLSADEKSSFLNTFVTGTVSALSGGG